MKKQKLNSVKGLVSSASFPWGNYKEYCDKYKELEEDPLVISKSTQIISPGNEGKIVLTWETKVSVIQFQIRK